jgi:hypothetical protein
MAWVECQENIQVIVTAAVEKGALFTMKQLLPCGDRSARSAKGQESKPPIR